MLGERIPARQAADWSSINRAYVADNEFEPRSRRSPSASRRPHALLRRYQAPAQPLAGRAMAGLALEASIQQEMATSRDFREGGMAFSSRRAAGFSGHDARSPPTDPRI